jgi:transmembrane sensor
MTEPDDCEQERLKREALGWLTRISLGDAAPQDLVDLRRWRDTSSAHAAALARAGRLWQELEAPVAAVARGDVEDAARRGAGGARLSRRAVLAGGAAVAATAAGLMMVRPPLDLWPSLAELEADHRTGIGEQRRLALPGAVSVDLNTRTSIALRGTDQDPAIELIAGETAVVIGSAATRPFVVIAADGRMTAARASFNVRREGAAVRLTCIDGEVAVECGSQRRELGAGQQAFYDGRGFGNVITIDPSTITAWRDGMLIFRNTPLTDVIEEVNRYRFGRIILLDEGLGRRLVTARFEIQRLDTVMGQIGSVFKVPVKSLPGGFVLVG